MPFPPSLGWLAPGPRPPRPVGRLASLAVGLTLALVFALSSPSGALEAAAELADPTFVALIEFEGGRSETRTGDEFETARTIQSTRRVGLRDFERAQATRIACPLLRRSVVVDLASPRALARPVADPCAGRDLLIRHRRFLI